MKKMIILMLVGVIGAFGTYHLLLSAPVFDVNDIKVNGRTISFASEIVTKWVPKMVTPKAKKMVKRQDVELLAEEFLLTEKTAFNPHLRYDDGDVSFWVEQCRKYGVDELDLRREFAARRMVLEAADEAGVVIDKKGDLSHAAGEIMADLIRARNSLEKKR